MSQILQQIHKYMLCILVIIGTGNLLGAPISQKTAELIARQFFANQLRTEANALPKIVYAPSLNSFRASQEKAYYVFNNGNSSGFVIVSADDRLPKIIGYSYTGTIDMNNLPIQLKSMLEAYRIATKYYVENNINIAHRTGSLRAYDTHIKPEVAPLLGKIEWNQDDPWNSKCPIGNNGQHLYVGCVATATAQIMRQHNWPDRGTGTYEYTEIISKRTNKVDFNTTYDWKNMPEKIEDKKKVTPEQREALSKLCYHVGVSCDMQYNEEASGSFLGYVVRALRENFRYDKNVKAVDRFTYTSEDWENLIKKELSEGRSVLYGGLGLGGGHAFVCDGYDSKGLFHINWGWNGQSNGYFELNLLDPSALGIGGGAGGGFNYEQQMLVNIKPDREGTSKNADPDIVSQEFEFRYHKKSDLLYCSRLIVYLSSEKTYKGKFRISITNTEDDKDVILSPESEEVELFFMPLTKNKREEVIGEKIPGIKAADCKFKANARYKIQPEVSTSNGFIPLIHFLGKHSCAYLNTDEKGKIKNITYDQDAPVITVNNDCSADIQGYEKSFLDFSIDNAGNEYRGNVTYRYKLHEEKNWKDLTVELYNIKHGHNKIHLYIDQMPAKPDSKVDFQIDILGKQHILIENIEVKKAASVRPGLILYYTGKTNESGEVDMNPFNGYLKNVMVRNISENESFKPFRASCYIMLTDGINDYGISAPHRYFFNEPFMGEKEIPLSFTSEELVKLILKKNSIENNPLIQLPAGTKLYFRIFIFLSELINGDVITALSDDLPPVNFNLGYNKDLTTTVRMTTSKAVGDNINLKIVPIPYFEANKSKPSLMQVEIIGAKKVKDNNYIVENPNITIKGGFNFLDCSNNRLSKLEIQGNSTLDKLICSHNEIKELNLVGQDKMRYIDCSDNKIENLQLTRNLDSIYCQNNAIKTLASPDYMVTTILNAANNQIEDIELKNLAGVVKLILDRNKLRELNLKELNMVNSVKCNNNLITSIITPDIVKIDGIDQSNFKELDCYNNKISEEGFEALLDNIFDRSDTGKGIISVVDGMNTKDNNKFSNNLRDLFKKKNWIVYDYNGGSLIPYDQNTLSTEEVAKTKARIYPNPATDFLIVESKKGDDVMIYSTNGQLIFVGKTDLEGQLRINIGGLSPNIYVVKLGNDICKIEVR